MKGYKIANKRIIESLKNDKRFDGRGCFDFRDIKVEVGISKNAEGSVSVKMGKTEVLVGVKMGVGTPYTDHEAEGTLMTAVELLPLSYSEYDYGAPKIEAIEPARIIDRGIRESGFIDFKGLCIKEKEKVWNIFLDVDVINDDGNVIDAGALGGVIALLTAKFPEYDEETSTINYGHFTNKKLPLAPDKMPLTMTFRKLAGAIFIDPNKEEELSAESRLTIEVSKPEKEEVINAMQKGGEWPLTTDEISSMIDLALDKAKFLRDVLNKSLK